LRRPWNLALAQALLLVFLLSLTHYYFDDRYAKAEVRGAVAHIAARGERDLPILAPNVGPVVKFYDGGLHDVLGCGNEPTIETAAEADALLARQLEGRQAAWVVSSHTWHLDPQDLLPAALARQGTLIRTHEGPGVAVDLWRRSSPVKEGP
jgi:acyl-homoserine lactone acylase PvdQ